MVDATPYPLPAGSRLLQDLGFLAFTLPEVAILMPTKKSRGQELTREQQGANQVLNQRRLRIEHVNSSVKRCRIVKDRSRLWKQGVRDLVMELCCALHNFRVRLTRLCRKVAFWRQNPKMGYWKINDLRASTFLFSVICDRAPTRGQHYPGPANRAKGLFTSVRK
jgi:hypothetical protein